MPFEKKHDALLIIPVFNEAPRIGLVLEKAHACSGGTADILVVNDGSVDNTAAVLALCDHAAVAEHPFNLGIGASFQTGCQFALRKGYRFIVRIDGDGQHDPACIARMLAPLVEGRADIVIGSRFLCDSSFTSSGPRLAGIGVIAGLLFLITGKKVTDPTSGMCAMNQRAFSFFAEHCVDDYPEPDILIHYRDFRMCEVPVAMSPRASGTSSITPLKSLYYMYKVIFSILAGSLRKDEVAGEQR